MRGRLTGMFFRLTSGYLFWVLSSFLIAIFAFNCSGDNNDDDQGDDDSSDDDLGDDDDTQPPLLALEAVEPSSGGASVSTQMILSGTGFAEGMVILVGSIHAENITVESDTQATAFFPPIPATECGPRTVTIELNEQRVSLENAFDYFFDEDPIIFVHGWTFGAWEWQMMIGRFRDLGYPEEYLAAIDYDDPVGSNVPQARDELPPFVDEVLAATGAEKVDVVAHSAGGISSRLWIRFFGGGDKVRDYLSLAGTHHGTVWSCAFTWTGDGARETCPAYADQNESVNNVQWDLNGSPDEPDVDETPFGVEDGGGISWNAIWSDADVIDVPPMTSCLNQQSRNDCDDPVNIAVHGVGHIELARDAEVFQIVVDRLRVHNVSKP